MIDFVVLTSHSDSDPKQFTLGWNELVGKLFANHRETACDADPSADDACVGKECSEKKTLAWSPCLYLPPGERRNEPGKEGHRLDVNVVAVTAAVFDLDHITEAQFHAVMRRLFTDGYAVAAHSTHNHRPKGDGKPGAREDWCLRLIVPLSRPVPAAQWRGFLARAVAHLEMPADPTCKNLSRIYFLPTHPRGGAYFTDACDGRPLDVDAILALPGPVHSAPAPAFALPSAPAASAPAPAEGPVVIDFEALTRSLQGLRRTYKARGDREKDALVERLLAGRALAVPGDAKENPDALPVGRDAEIHRAMSILACRFPANTPAEVAVEMARRSIGSMETAPEGLDYWLREARDCYERAMLARVERDRLRDEINAQTRRDFYALAGIGDPPKAPAKDEESEASDPDEPVPEKPWTADLLLQPLRKDEDPETAKRRLRNCEWNARLLLMNLPEWKGAIRWNELTSTIDVEGAPLAPNECHLSVLPRAVGDWFERHVGLTLKESVVKSVLLLVARTNPYNPVTEYAAGLGWDGTSRIADMLIRYCGAVTTDASGNDITQHVREVSKKWMVGAAARALEPGCKMDTVLVLEGETGIRKSTFFKELGGPFSTTLQLNLTSKDSTMIGARSWIVELAELDSLRKSEREATNAFITIEKDVYRPPYGAAPEAFPRGFVLVGTTEDSDWNPSEKGARRWWPVKVLGVPVQGELLIDRQAIRRDRDQLWAEAVTIAKRGLAEKAAAGGDVDAISPENRWWFDGEAARQARRVAAERVQTTSVEEALVSWWYALPPEKRPVHVTTLDALREAMMLTPDRVNHGLRIEAGRVLKEKFGFAHKQINVEGRPWVYVSTTEARTAKHRPKGEVPVLELVASARVPR